MHRVLQFDGTESRSASDSLPRHCRPHGHTVYPRPEQLPIDRSEDGRRRHVEGSARPSAENLSLVRGPAADRKISVTRPGSRSVASVPFAIAKTSGPPAARHRTIATLTAQPDATSSATPPRRSLSSFRKYPSSPIAI